MLFVHREAQHKSGASNAVPVLVSCLSIGLLEVSSVAVATTTIKDGAGGYANAVPCHSSPAPRPLAQASCSRLGRDHRGADPLIAVLRSLPHLRVQILEADAHTGAHCGDSPLIPLLTHVNHRLHRSAPHVSVAILE